MITLEERRLSFMIMQFNVLSTWFVVIQNGNVFKTMWNWMARATFTLNLVKFSLMMLRNVIIWSLPLCILLHDDFYLIVMLLVVSIIIHEHFNYYSWTWCKCVISPGIRKIFLIFVNCDNRSICQLFSFREFFR